MKNQNFKFLTVSATLAGILFIGCGTDTKSGLSQQPHDTSKLNRTISDKKDWTWNVGQDGWLDKSGVHLKTYFFDKYPDGMKHFQTFIDIDSDDSTGFSGEGTWEVNGADYLIEDDGFYKYVGNEKTNQWKWQLLSDIDIDLFFHKTEFSIGYRIKGEKFYNIFNTGKPFEVMIEAYDWEWKGDSNTVVGITTMLEKKEVIVNPENITTEDVKKALKKNDKYANYYTHKIANDGKTVMIFSTVSDDSEGLYRMRRYELFGDSLVKNYSETIGLNNIASDFKFLGNGDVIYKVKEKEGKITATSGGHMFFFNNLPTGKVMTFKTLLSQYHPFMDTLMMDKNSTEARIIEKYEEHTYDGYSRLDSKRFYYTPNKKGVILHDKYRNFANIQYHDLNDDSKSYKILKYQRSGDDYLLVSDEKVDDNSIEFKARMIEKHPDGSRDFLIATLKYDFLQKKVISCEGNDKVCTRMNEINK